MTTYNRRQQTDRVTGTPVEASPYPGMKPNVGELNYWGSIVDISKFMSMCNKSRHTGLGLKWYRPINTGTQKVLTSIN